MKTKKIWAISIVVLLMCGGIMTTGAFSGTTDNNKGALRCFVWVTQYPYYPLKQIT